MLLNNEVISASALADKYQVSQRTIYRDIDAIYAAGIPVVSYQGVNGGYGIIETYKNNAWYLYGYCRKRKDYREFRLSRMTDLIYLPEQSQRKHDVPLGRTSFEDVATTNPVNVVLHFSTLYWRGRWIVFTKGEELPSGRFSDDYIETRHA